MANVTLLGANYADVPAVSLPKTEGGQALFWDMDTQLSYMGVNTEYLQNVYEVTYKLEDTLFDTWTPSTTAKVIVTSMNVSPVFPVDMGDYEYMLVWRFRFDAHYTETVTKKVIPISQVQTLYQYICKRPGSAATIDSQTFNTNSCVTQFIAPLMLYYNSSGTRTYVYSASYGFYIGATAATFSNATSNTPNMTIKTPTISARCSTTYMTTARAKELDKTVDCMNLVGSVYRMNKDNFIEDAYREIVARYNTQTPI